MWNLFRKSEPKKEVFTIDKKITIDLTEINSPKITVGKNITPDDIATFIVRSSLNLDAKQYVDAMKEIGYVNAAFLLGSLTQQKMQESTAAILSLLEKEATEKAEKSDDPIISPLQGF